VKRKATAHLDRVISVQLVAASCRQKAEQ